MKTIIKLRIAMLVSAVALITSCALAPVNGHYETAETLGEGGVELMANYSRYYYTGSADQFEFSNQNFGAQIGFGLSEKNDLKIRYERLIPQTFENEVDEEFQVNFVGISPKLGTNSGNWAFKIPFNAYLSSDWNYYSVGFSAFRTKTFSPNANFTLGLHNQNMLYFNEGFGINPNFGLSLGLGFGPSDKWQIRPEAGIIADIEGSIYVNFGAAVVLSFKK